MGRIELTSLIGPERVVLYGAGGHTIVLESIARLRGLRVGAILNDWPAPADFHHSAPLVIGEAQIAAWLRNARDDGGWRYAVAIGHAHGAARFAKHQMLRDAALEPLTIRHPTAFVDDTASIGDATHVLAFAHVGPHCRIGEAVILNTRSSVDHECTLENGVHIAPGATLAGRVHVGANTMIGTGASVGPDVSIAADSIIGAGAVVVGNIIEPGVYVGVPARRTIDRPAI